MSVREPTPENVEAAAEAIRRGELVGMPTETVYGIAADATHRKAVLRVFQAKGRPADNPLIVHVAHLSQVELLAAEVPERAQLLAELYWPGPLTLILPKRPEVLPEVTGGRSTVAVRIPSHPVALRLIDASGVPIAAPSANPFMGLSPTQADHLDRGLSAQLSMVLDGGPCEVGLESTVVDLSGSEPRLLRPGAISRAEIEGALGTRLGGAVPGERNSPGQYARHYSPRTPLHLTHTLRSGEAGITFSHPGPLQIQLPREPRAYGISLYAALHRLDAEGHSRILIESPPETPEWEAVWDRLRKAAGS